jgi:hypothetical protein
MGEGATVISEWAQNEAVDWRERAMAGMNKYVKHIHTLRRQSGARSSWALYKSSFQTSSVARISPKVGLPR